MVLFLGGFLRVYDWWMIFLNNFPCFVRVFDFFFTFLHHIFFISFMFISILGIFFICEYPVLCVLSRFLLYLIAFVVGGKWLLLTGLIFVIFWTFELWEIGALLEACVFNDVGVCSLACQALIER